MYPFCAEQSECVIIGVLLQSDKLLESQWIFNRAVSTIEFNWIELECLCGVAILNLNFVFTGELLCIESQQISVFEILNWINKLLNERPHRRITNKMQYTDIRWTFLTATILLLLQIQHVIDFIFLKCLNYISKLHFSTGFSVLNRTLIWFTDCLCLFKCGCRRWGCENISTSSCQCSFIQISLVWMKTEKKYCQIILQLDWKYLV